MLLFVSVSLSLLRFQGIEGCRWLNKCVLVCSLSFIMVILCIVYGPYSYSCTLFITGWYTLSLLNNFKIFFVSMWLHVLSQLRYIQQVTKLLTNCQKLNYYHFKIAHLFHPQYPYFKPFFSCTMVHLVFCDSVIAQIWGVEEAKLTVLQFKFNL